MWFLVLAAIAYVQNSNDSIKANFLGTWFVISILPVIFLIISLLYSENINQGFKSIQTKLGFIIIPLFIFLTKPILEEDIVKFYRWVLGLFVPVFLYDIISLLLENYRFNQFESIEWGIFQYHSLAFHLGVHSIYLSVVVAIFLLFSIDALITGKIKSKFLVFIVVPLLVAFLFSLAAKMVVIAFVMSMVFYFILHSNTKRLKPKSVIIALLIVSSIGLIIFQNDFVRKRFQVTWQIQNVQEGLDYTKDAWGSFELRFALLYSSWEGIKKNWILGTGIGDVRSVHKESYEDKNFQFAIEQGFNSHNQYIDTWIAAGLPGLLALMFSLFFSLYMSVKYKYPLFGAFILLYIMVLLTENHFDRLHGVSTFAFFYAFLIRNSKVIGETKDGFSLN